ncbi:MULTISPECIES: universal stress protein [Natrialba]|uniref:Universal stress protein n=1 Tax=Natrialba swarupiae TaxID=2448032 RepID=A0A5D5AJ50_9EURY|nr:MULTISPECIES: universal stress protein [Natrialba]MWV41012.1 universal stress protein [Natrialba sp. INN-245]TYT60963.1 universal stress protein [Natrialba swarupiae]
MFTVVAGIDKNENRAAAVADAIESLPGEDETEVVLVHSFTDNPEGASVDQIGTIRRVRERLEAEEIDVQLDGRSGDPATTLLEAATEYDADLVAVGARERSPAGKAVFGSVTQSVILEGDRSVLVCTAGDFE